MLGLNGKGNPAVYRPEVPKTDMALMPQKAVAVRYNGGANLFSGSMLPVSTPRVDLTCYGSTRQEADEVAVAVFVALKSLSMQTFGGVMLYWAKPITPIPLPDAQTLWNASVVTAQVMVADQGVSP